MEGYWKNTFLGLEVLLVFAKLEEGLQNVAVMFRFYFGGKPQGDLRGRFSLTTDI